MKVLIILNPASGKNAIELIREAVTRQFANSKVDFEIYESKKEDDLGDIVRARLKEGFELVVAAGGDGTVSNVINGLVGTHIPLGIIPAGTANLLAQELKVPLSIEDAIALIIGRHEFKKIDAMKIGPRVYDLNVSSGLSATVVSNTTPENKSRFGFFAYVWMTIVKLFTLKDHYFVVKVDGKTLKYRAAEIAIFNCGIIAKSLYPQGSDILVDDGRLNVWVLNAKTIQDYPWYLFQIWYFAVADFIKVFNQRPQAVAVSCHYHPFPGHQRRCDRTLPVRNASDNRVFQTFCARQITFI
jgi:diacylglycerol kinase family enzyme